MIYQRIPGFITRADSLIAADLPFFTRGFFNVRQSMGGQLDPQAFEPKFRTARNLIPADIRSPVCATGQM
jgi:hypothetical protein